MLNQRSNNSSALATRDQRPTGTVFDIGYRRYDGPREGRSLARRAVFIDAIRNSLGIGRGGWAKVLPWVFVAPPLGVGGIFASIAYFANQTLGDEVSGVIDLPSHVTLFTVSGYFIFLFAAVMGPELTCPDRRNRVFDLYLVRPITVADYLFSKWIAFCLMLFCVTLLPQVFLWVSSVLVVPNAVEWVSDEWVTLPRMFGASAVIAIFATSFVFLVSSVTDRRAIASVLLIGIVMVVPVVLSIASLVAGEGGYAAGLVGLLDPVDLPTQTVVQVFFGEEFSGSDVLHPLIPIAWCGVLATSFTAVTWVLYDNFKNR